jgi:hypothetical protein
MNRAVAIGFALPLLALAAPAAEWADDFSSDPATCGWRVFGDASLFSWSAADGLSVTWDSTKTNSFFHRPLGTILAETDAFTVGFDLTFAEIQAGGPDGTGGTFELAFGLYGTNAAFRPEFARGSGVNAARGPRDIVEFTYFPDTVNGFGDTLSPSVWSRGNQPHLDFIFPYPLHIGVPYRLTMNYTPSPRVLETVLVSNAVPVLTNRVALPATSTGFRLDALAVASYRSGGGGSILARARLERVSVSVPDPPALAVAWTPGGADLAFALPTNWVAAIERTQDFTAWETVVATNAIPAGTGAELHRLDPAAPSTNAFYRLKLTRP